MLSAFSDVGLWDLKDIIYISLIIYRKSCVYACIPKAFLLFPQEISFIFRSCIY